MKFRAIILIIIFFSIKASAKELPDTIIIRQDNSIERIGRDLDSLTNSWYAKIALKKTPIQGDSLGRDYPDSVYENRISKINSIVKLQYNNIIRNHINVYTVQKRQKFCVVLGLMDYYFPIIEDIFDSYGLPTELKYMAVIESALNPNAVSKAGATGLWQFMFSTGKLYGITINSIVDERRDPVKATHAAARYLKDLYSIFNDWGLVIAAYNCGPGNVNKAIKRSGNKKDYWDIYYKLPRETRGYIPMYVAAVYAVTYYKEHKIKPFPLEIPIATDTIMFNKDIHLSQISAVLGIPMGELKALNPQYRTGLIPGSVKPMALTLPLQHVGEFIDLNDTIINYKTDVYLNKDNRISDPTRSTYTHIAIKGKTKVYYTVKHGDNLGFISDWFRVNLSEIRSWNNIYRNNIRAGQRPVIYVDPSRSEYFSKINTMSFAEKQTMVGKSVPENQYTVEKTAPTMQVQNEGEYITHTVRYGDTIWDIVRKYGDVSASDVLTLNNISDPQKIKVGQKLKIKKKI
jgi:membrane-bound lytic murein transglycosylase D